ncbi:MAG: hypothetical protein Q8877_02825 [Sweet potato little leaf phytoplasma]|nr:hypothetical protein [Sweet potato little leaf phytoplasma]
MVMLANILLHGRKVALSQLLLAKLYAMLVSISDHVRKQKTLITNVGDLNWLLQLWLNAIMQSKIQPSICIANKEKWCYGNIMNIYTCPSLPSNTSPLRYFFSIFNFIDLASTDVDTAHFVNRAYGQDWFTRPLPAFDNPEKDDLSIWRHYLSQRILFAKLPGSTYNEEKDLTKMNN